MNSISKGTIKRLTKEWNTIQQNSSDKYFATPCGEDLFKWHVHLFPPAESVYAGGTYVLTIDIPPQYPFKPPKCSFSTKIYHPKIDSNTGDFSFNEKLGNQWTPSTTLDKIVDDIFDNLFYPDFQNPMNSNIALEMISNQNKFVSTVEDWVIRYAQ
eukprot:gene8550-373_t